MMERNPFNPPEYYNVSIGNVPADPYRIILAYGITHPCQQHALKKLLRAGRRDAPALRKDVEEAMEVLARWLDMMDEENEAIAPRQP